LSTQISSTQTAMIAAISAIIGVFLGFVGNYVIARRNLKKEISLKVAEYRIQWINNLNDEFSAFSSACNVHLTLDAKMLAELYKAFGEQHRSIAKIKLLMNRSDEDYDELVGIMGQMIVSSGQGRDEPNRFAAYNTMRNLQNQYINVANRIVKREWRKTKSNLRADTITVEALKSNHDYGYIYRTVGAANSTQEARGGLKY